MQLQEKGVFDVVKGVLVGKPQDEAYYQEYKDILIRVIDNEKLPIVYNVNFTNFRFIFISAIGQYIIKAFQTST